jgi:8-oxo-dGTP pyrophosphatase MutT (NUDIX family)
MTGKPDIAYGGILIDRAGLVLLREPANHYGGYHWTFAKGKPDPGETPAQAALREVLEETGQAAEIIAPIPGLFAGTTSATAFFLMRPVGPQGPFSWETWSTRWADKAEARILIEKTPSETGRSRDLAILDAAFDLWRALHPPA